MVNTKRAKDFLIIIKRSALEVTEVGKSILHPSGWLFLEAYSSQFTHQGSTLQASVLITASGSLAQTDRNPKISIVGPPTW